MIQRYSIGYCEEGKYANRVIFPSYDQKGQLNYFTARAIYDSMGLKYLTPRASKIELIFNELFLDFSEPIILTEGVFDSIRIENAIPLLGSTLSRHSLLFKRIVESKPLVYVALDKDAKQKALKIIKQLSEWNVDTKYVDLNKWNDLGEIPDDQLTAIFSNCASGNFQNQISLSLS